VSLKAKAPLRGVSPTVVVDEERTPIACGVPPAARFLNVSCHVSRPHPVLRLRFRHEAAATLSIHCANTKTRRP
jgi:hypothetical protein